MKAVLSRARVLLNAFGNGVFRVLWYLLLVLLVVGFVRSAMGHLHYLLSAEPRLLTTVEEALKLSADEPFLLRLPLDWEHGLQIEARTSAYTLVPVRGAHGRLIVARKGHAQPAEMLRPQQLQGRVVGRGLFGDWDGGELDSSIDLVSEFHRIGYEVPEDALLLVVDWPFDGNAVWQLTVGLVVLVILVAGVVRFLLRLRRPSSDGRAAS